MELTGAAIVNVPAVLNPVTVGAFHAALQQASAEDVGCAIVLVDADTRTFCLGLDLAAALDNGGAADALGQFVGCLEAIRLSPKPTVSYIRGAVRGGGVGIAAACDGVLAAPTATFATTELRFGLTPSIIAPYLAERMTAQKLRWMALTSQPVDARSALQVGLVDRICADGDAPRVLRAWVAGWKRADAKAMALWKRASSPAGTGGLQTTLDRLADEGVRGRIGRFLEADAVWREDEQ